MREILFRGKRIDNGEWVYGNYCGAEYLTKEGIEHLIIEVPRNASSEPIIPETVGQYTGLTDMNGKKIFEGDIIVFNRKRNLPYYKVIPEVVFYDERNAQFTRVASPYATLQKDMMSECEVIGNIHDNPELLKGE